MRKSSYFKVVGYVELVCSAIYIIYSFVELCRSHPANAGEAWLKILAFIAIAFIAPAVGMLFLTYGKDYEKRESDVKPKEQTQKASVSSSESTKTPKEDHDHSTKEE